MSTRSSITYKNEDGKFVTIYCHYDGYVSHNGVILQEAYDTLDKVKKLVSGGDLSVLGRSCDKPEDGAEDEDGSNFCKYYIRDMDREEEHNAVRVIDDYSDLLLEWQYDYHYLFKDGQWYVMSIFGGGCLKPVVDAIEDVDVMG